MSNWRDQQLTRAVQGYDKALYVKSSASGLRQLFRKRSANPKFDQYILSLTENWSANGKPADWGVCPLLDKITRIDAANKQFEAAELEKHNQKADEKKDRAIYNQMEAFASDWQGQFKETFKDINTSNLEKKDKRRIKDGNRK